MEKYCLKGKIECNYYHNGHCLGDTTCHAKIFNRDTALFGHLAEIIEKQKEIIKRLNALEAQSTK